MGLDVILKIIEEVLKHFSKKRAREIREIISKELRDGDFSRIDEDVLVAIIHRICVDISEGTAKNNLRLLAQSICGLSKHNKLICENFKKYEKILVDLSEDEIHILSSIIKHYDEEKETLVSSCVDRALVEICGIPENCDKNKYEKCIEILSSLERTGLVIQQGKTINAIQTGALYHSPYSITSLMKEMIKFFPNWLDIATGYVAE